MTIRDIEDSYRLGRVNLTVIHLITTFDHGGAEKQLLESLKFFPSGIEHVVFWIKGPGTLQLQLRHRKIESYSLFQNLRFFLRLMLKGGLLSGNKDNARKTIIHAHLPRAELLGAFITWIFGVILVVSKHNTEPMWPKGNKTISKILAKIVYTLSSRIICISKTVQEYLETIDELPVNSNKVCVINYGVDLTQSKIHLINPKLCKKVPTIGTLSRYVPQKDLRTLILAAQELKSKGIEAIFKCHGEGDERGQLQELVRQCNLEDSFFILEKTFDSELFLRECDVFVLTSKYEGFGLVILEAARSGTPMLISNSVAATEVLSGNKELLFQIGDYVQLSQRIINLITNREAYLSNIKASLQASSKYDICTTVANLKKMYESL